MQKAGLGSDGPRAGIPAGPSERDDLASGLADGSVGGGTAGLAAGPGCREGGLMHQAAIPEHRVRKFHRLLQEPVVSALGVGEGGRASCTRINSDT
jgi:hypothetical protein